MSNFAAVTADEVERLLKSMPSTSSPLDCILTSLIKSCSGTFAELIARLANLSFEHSIIFLVKFKIAEVTLLLKKHGLDVSDLAKLNTICKILEWLVLIWLVLHASMSSNFNAVQSAHRRLHSCSFLALNFWYYSSQLPVDVTKPMTSNKPFSIWFEAYFEQCRENFMNCNEQSPNGVV